MEKIKELFKNKKLVLTVGGIMALIVVCVIGLVLLKQNNEEGEVQEPNKNTTPVSEEKEKPTGLTFMKNEDCVSYIEKLEEVTYDTLLESEYSSSLYKYNQDEDNEYYLVCLVNIKYNDKDLVESLENKDLTIEDLNKKLKEQKLESLMISNSLKEEEKEEDSKEDDEKESTDKKEEPTKKPSSSSSSNKKPSSSSNSSSNSNKNNSSSSNSSSNSKPSSGSSTSSKEKDNATLRKQLAAAGLSWDFNTKAEAEAFMKKWVNRGFTAGYYINNYGDSDTAYSGYVTTGKSTTCGLTTTLTIDWHNETSTMTDKVLYLHSLGYDCTGYCTRDGICY